MQLHHPILLVAGFLLVVFAVALRAQAKQLMGNEDPEDRFTFFGRQLKGADSLDSITAASTVGWMILVVAGSAMCVFSFTSSLAATTGSAGDAATCTVTSAPANSTSVPIETSCGEVNTASNPQLSAGLKLGHTYHFTYTTVGNELELRSVQEVSGGTQQSPLVR